MTTLQRVAIVLLLAALATGCQAARPAAEVRSETTPATVIGDRVALLQAAAERTKVSVIDTPGAPPRLIAELPERVTACIDQGISPPSPNPDPAHLVLFGKEQAYSVDLRTGAVAILPRLLPGQGEEYQPVYRTADHRAVAAYSRIAASPDGRYALVPRYQNYQTGDEHVVADFSVVLYDLAAETVVWEHPFGPDESFSFRISYGLDGGVLFSHNGRLYSRGYRTGDPLRELGPMDNWVHLSPKRDRAIIDEGAGGNRLWTMPECQPETGIRLPGGTGQFGFSPDGRMLAANSSFGDTPHGFAPFTVYLFDLSTGQQTALLENRSWNSWPMFSPDGTTLTMLEAEPCQFRDGRTVLIDRKVSRHTLATGTTRTLVPPIDPVEQISPMSFTTEGVWLWVTPIANAFGPLTPAEWNRRPARLLRLRWDSDQFEEWIAMPAQDYDDGGPVWEWFVVGAGPAE